MSLNIYNSISRRKEEFTPMHEGRIGMYVCGPTVYSDVHIGNIRTFVNFDVVYRYLLAKGYKVRYVRNITDVGHLEGDLDIGGEDKISKKARLEQLEPMEIVQRYSNGFHRKLELFNALPPSIEPRATQHIIEQIEMVQSILDNGFAYIVNGSVYFDTKAFAEKHDNYGKLSGRKIEDLLEETRDDLKNQGEKRYASDFAIWIKADPNHLMRWPSPWSVGFPGWHLECSVMSTKYLGQTFDIHGGGTDLKFPHHENEVAQNIGSCGCAPAKTWMHANMLLMNGRKMSKSDGNHITPDELFTGDSDHISKAYSPMALRFFMLQAHYRSTLDLTDSALSAAEKGYKRLMESYANVLQLKSDQSDVDSALKTEILEGTEAVWTEMDDDFNSPKALARLFELASKVNSLKDGHLDMNDIDAGTLQKLQQVYQTFIEDIFGLKVEESGGQDDQALDRVMQLIIDIRAQARENKDWGTSDLIRDTLNEAHIQLKDGKDGTTWARS
jgi:cysteinyl-tRNA synthetase